jgi:3-dehydroquinate dehydratase-2
MTKRVLIVNGPNLNLLGQREPDIYGSTTLEQIEKDCANQSKVLGLENNFVQSNHEGEIVQHIQNASSDFDGIIINAAGYTHTSVAIRDALAASTLPIIEVHLSNIFKREEFRHQSYISDIAHGVICGFGSQGYLLALQAVSNILSDA